MTVRNPTMVSRPDLIFPVFSQIASYFEETLELSLYKVKKILKNGNLFFSPDDEQFIDVDDDESDGSQPGPAYGQAIILVKDKELGPLLYSFGGTDGVRYSMDVHRFSFKNLAWALCYKTQVERPAPMPRYRHELAQYGSKVFVLGGGTSFTVFDFIKIWCFDTTLKGQHGCGDWVEVPTLGDPTCPIRESGTEQFPAPRRCHECVQRGKCKLFFFVCKPVNCSRRWHFFRCLCIWWIRR